MFLRKDIKDKKEVKKGFKWSKTSYFESSNEMKYTGSRLKVSDEINDRVSDIYETFDQLIDNEMLNKIAEYTNKRLSLNVTPISVVELRAFIGLLLLLGACGKRHIEISEIWRPGSIHYSDHAASTMCRQRFQQIAANLCFDDLLDLNVT